MTYGADWQLDRPDWRVSTTIGQSYRLSDKPALISRRHRPAGRFSDFVGRPRCASGISSSSRTASASTRTISLSAATRSTPTVGASRTYLEVGYLRLNRDITRRSRTCRTARSCAPPAAWRSPVLVGVRLGGVQPDRPGEDPTFMPTVRADADPARRRLCRRLPRVRPHLAARLRRRIADARKGDTFQVYFSLRNLGLPLTTGGAPARELARPHKQRYPPPRFDEHSAWVQPFSATGSPKMNGAQCAAGRIAK